MDKLSLKWKVFLALLFFCALLLIVLWLLQTVFLNDMYRFVRMQELEQTISLVEKEIDNPDLSLVLQRIQDENDIMITLARDFIPPQNAMMDRQGGPGNNIPMNAITQTREFTLQNGQKLSLTFYAMLVPVSATVSTLRIQLLVVTAVMLLFSIVLAIVIAKRVSKPIEEISKSAQTLAKGDYDTRFAGKGFSEIVSLSDTLNMTAVELGRVEGLRRELLANVSHDLRTPLALIYSYAEMMHDFSDEITPEQTRVVMDEAQRLTMLVNDVLDISKLESEMEKLNCSNYNLTQCVLETVERTKELLSREGFEILFVHGDDVYVNADRTKIDRAFYNLLVNAINYSNGLRSISVEQTVVDDRVRISVTDKGEGIAEAELPFIWDRYYKSEKAHKRALAGTGLGLSIVKKIIDLHKGSYGVISKIDEGSTFWFELKTV
jgi:signal transduction histidine kinase